MEGVLKFLTGNSPVAQSLRNIYVFKIVPLLNPEGVLCGNFRSSFTGTDLNRRWDQPDEILHSQIFYLKTLMKKLSTEGKKILVFCDFHGHSRKNNSFIYGCNKAAKGGFCSWTKVRLLPKILASKTHFFNYNDCRFKVENDKRSTARVVVWKEFEVTNSFTLESSFYGYMRGNEIKAFTTQDYKDIGEAFLTSLLEYHYILKSIELEMKINHGWLKPSMLITLTGTAASDLLAKKLREEKQEAKRKHRLATIKKAINEKKGKVSLLSKFDTKRNKRSSEKMDTPLGKAKNDIQLQMKTLEPVANINLPEISLSKSPHEDNKLLSNRFETENKPQDWRNYFSKDEIQNAFEKINEGEDPNDEEESNGSDSCPSDDNKNEDEINTILEKLSYNKPTHNNKKASKNEEKTILVTQMGKETKLEDSTSQKQTKNVYTLSKGFEVSPQTNRSSKRTGRDGSLIIQTNEVPPTFYSSYAKDHVTPSSKLEITALSSLTNPIKVTEAIKTPERPKISKLPQKNIRKVSYKNQCEIHLKLPLCAIGMPDTVPGKGYFDQSNIAKLGSKGGSIITSPSNALDQTRNFKSNAFETTPKAIDSKNSTKKKQTLQIDEDVISSVPRHDRYGGLKFFFQKIKLEKSEALEKKRTRWNGTTPVHIREIYPSSKQKPTTILDFYSNRYLPRELAK